MIRKIQELLQFSFINLDKSSGPTSFSVSDYIRKSLNINKTSHGGTLDPQVSGILPIMLGRACRLSDYLMHKDKTYIGIMRLHKDISQESLEKIIEKFIGKIKQLPPVRSRVKRAVRERTIHSFELLEKNNKDILFKTKVQAGTYIRKLCDDIGKEIQGAHMLELRRIQAGIFSEPAITLYDFDKAVQAYKLGNEKPLRNILIPAEEIIKKILPIAQVNPKSLSSLLTGKPLFKQDIINLPKEELFALFHKDAFIGIYKKSQEQEILARPEFVFN